MLVVNYTGNKLGDLTLVIKDPRFKKEYDFSTGSCKCTDADALVIITENPLAFSAEGLPVAVKTPENTDPSENTDAPDA